MNVIILGSFCGGASSFTYRGALHDVPPDGFVPAALAEVQQVVHHDLAD